MSRFNELPYANNFSNFQIAQDLLDKLLEKNRTYSPTIINIDDYRSFLSYGTTTSTYTYTTTTTAWTTGT
jgi:hypothetical protein